MKPIEEPWQMLTLGAVVTRGVSRSWGSEWGSLCRVGEPGPAVGDDSGDTPGVAGARGRSVPAANRGSSEPAVPPLGNSGVSPAPSAQGPGRDHLVGPTGQPSLAQGSPTWVLGVCAV